MRFKFDKTKSRRLRTTRGIGFEEVQELFYAPYYLNQLAGEPEQWVAIGRLLPSRDPLEIDEGREEEV